MAKVQHFSGISKRIPFEGFDFYDLFRVTFENSELGRMKRLLPLNELDTFHTDATCYESEMRYPTDQKLLFGVDAKKIGGDTGYAGTANRDLC